MSFAENCMDELHEIMMVFKHSASTDVVSLLFDTLKQVKNLNNKYTRHIANSLGTTKKTEEN